MGAPGSIVYGRPMETLTRWQDLPLAVVDVETTGLDPASDRVIEIAVIHMCGAEVEDRWSTLVNPERALPEDAARITGIDASELETAPPFASIADELLVRLEGRAFVAYNLPFDSAFVASELGRAGHTWQPSRGIDPLVFVKELHRGQGAKRLGAAAARLGIELEEAHRAAADAEVAGRVLYALGADLPEALEDLLMLQTQWAQQQANERASWRSNREGRAQVGGAIGGGLGAFGPVERGNALGPAYLYGEDADHVRAMFAHLPDSGSRR